MEGDAVNRWLILVATVAVDLAALTMGAWWVIVLTGLVVGVAVPGRAAFTAMIAGTVAAGAASLVWQGGARTLDIADLTGAIALNTRGLGWAVLAVTLVYIALLALAGGWLGAAARRAVAGVRPAPAEPTEPSTDPLVDRKDEHV
jgi:Na+/H+ antiporter NhaC